MSESLAGHVSDYFAIDEGDNLSDHNPIVMNIKLNVQYSLSEERLFTKEMTWKKADEIDILAYKNVFCKLLNKIGILSCVVHCKHMFCREHMNDIYHYSSAIAASYKVSLK